MKYLAHYLYVSPKGTYNELEEDPTIESKAFVCEKLTDAIGFVRDIFDGLDMFNEKIMDEIIEAFTDGEESYWCDDHSAGQWFRISKISDKLESQL